jgi:transcription elongation factor GreB
MARNYITAAGLAKLQAELAQLVRVERPKTVDEVSTAAAHGDRSENAEYKYGKLRLRDIDRRIRFLDKRIRDAVVVEEARDGQTVFFGATVDIEDEDGARKRYTLVGEDESDPARGRVSWKSPLGRALMKRRVGDVVTVRRPAGPIDVEILAVSYDADTG